MSSLHILGIHTVLSQAHAVTILDNNTVVPLLP